MVSDPSAKAAVEIAATDAQSATVRQKQLLSHFILKSSRTNFFPVVMENNAHPSTHSDCRDETKRLERRNATNSYRSAPKVCKPPRRSRSIHLGWWPASRHQIKASSL